MSSRSKAVTVTVSITEMKNDPHFHSLTDEDQEVENLVQKILALYHPESGILEHFIENDDLTMQWIPERVDRTAEAYHKDAIEMAKIKKFDISVQKWKQASEINPDDVDYLYKLGLVYFELKKYAEALKYLNKTVRICPIHAKANLLAGICCMKLKKINEAEIFVNQSYRLDKSNILIYLNLGAIYSIKKKYNEAIQMFQEALQLNPKDVRAFLGLAKTHRMVNDDEAANAYFKKVIEVAPGTKAAEFAQSSIKVTEKEAPLQITEIKRNESLEKGRQSYITGKFEESNKIFTEYVKLQPSDDYAWYLLGETKIRLGNFPEASDCFKRSIKINSNNGLFFKSLGLVFHLQGKSIEAIEVLKKAIDLGKTDPFTDTLYGINCLREKKHIEGIKYLEESIRKDPNSPLALYQLALARIKQNQMDQAKSIVNKLMAIDVECPIKEQAETLLTEIQ